MEGIKHDSDKLRYELLPIEPIEALVAVLGHGAKKYEDWNWQKVVADKPERYYAAALRHITAWRKGEKLDPESDLPHLAHAMCCLVFLLAGGEKK